jgi:threonine synthase
MAMVSRNGFGCEPASAATVAGIKKLLEDGAITKDETVVGILTGHMLKDFQSIVDYHFNSANRFANTPLIVENDVEAILQIVNVSDPRSEHLS